jgi:hypothetical protein
MTWFEDTNRHIIESKNTMHRLLYCQLCQKLISQSECQRLRQDKNGNMYKVKRYDYDKLSKVKRLQELPSIELNKIVKHVL